MVIFLYDRQIGKMLNAREPKIINGPQILNKYVGESEANIRQLFAEAEEEEKRVSYLPMAWSAKSLIVTLCAPPEYEIHSYDLHPCD